MISIVTKFLLLITLIAPCVAHQTLTLPKPTGPHPIETMAIEVRDDTRRIKITEVYALIPNHDNNSLSKARDSSSWGV